jgi:hypothetical protein
MKCRTCMFWYRGVITHVAEDSRTWEGAPHPDAGKKIVQYVNGRSKYGKCRGSHESKPVTTTADFGCIFWKHDDNSDKFDHHYVRYAGQESLEQAIAKVKEDTEEFEREVVVKLSTIRFHTKNGILYLECSDNSGGQQLTHIDRPATEADTQIHKEEYAEYCNSMYLPTASKAVKGASQGKAPQQPCSS